MTIFQRWRIKRNRKEIEGAVAAYNDALKNLSTAAEEILRVAEKSGVATDGIRASVAEMRKIAKTAVITPLDLQRGGKHRERQKEQRARI